MPSRRQQRRHTDRQDAALAAAYARIPDVNCTGACWASCAAIELAPRERDRLAAAGYQITPVAQAHAQPEGFFCEALTGDGRCGAYQIRPAVCRLWGAVDGMRCPHGCQPVGGARPLTVTEAYAILADVADAAGDPAGAQRIRHAAAILADPQTARAALASILGTFAAGMDGYRRRAALFGSQPGRPPNTAGTAGTDPPPSDQTTGAQET